MAQQNAAKQKGLSREYEILAKRLREHEKYQGILLKSNQKGTKAYNDVATSIAATREQMAKIKSQMEDVGKGSDDTGKKLK